MTFNCKGGCGRVLPDWMNTGRRICSKCKDDTTTEEQKRALAEKSGSASDSTGTKYNQATNSIDHSRQEPTSTQNSSSTLFEDPTRTTDIDSTDESTHFYIQPKVTDEASLTPCDVFALGRYDADNYSSDVYSKNLLEFTKKGDFSHFQYFKSHMERFFDLRVDAVPDAITIYPSHNGGVSEGLYKLVKEVTANRDAEYYQYLSRSSPRPKQRRQSYSERWDNQRGSIEVQGNPAGEIVFLIDDVVTSGASITVGSNALIEQGAAVVIGLCLGLATNQQGEYIRRFSKNTHTIGSVLKNE